MSLAGPWYNKVRERRYPHVAREAPYCAEYTEKNRPRNHWASRKWECMVMSTLRVFNNCVPDGQIKCDCGHWTVAVVAETDGSPPFVPRLRAPSFYTARPFLPLSA